MAGKDTRGDPEKQSNKPAPQPAPQQEQHRVGKDWKESISLAEEQERAKAKEKKAAEEHKGEEQENKLHEMRHMVSSHELEHNYHAPDKTDEGEKLPAGHEELKEGTTLTGKPARGVQDYGPGPEQVPFHKLRKQR